MKNDQEHQRNQHSAYMRNYRKLHPEKSKQRNEYLKKWAKEHQVQIKKYKEKFYKTHPNYRPPYDKESQKKYHQKIRLEVIKLLGGKCVNPYNINHGGFVDNICYLQIDHINGGGTKERLGFPNSRQYYLYVLKQLRADSKDYQLLCANCNWIKKYKNNENVKLR